MPLFVYGEVAVMQSLIKSALRASSPALAASLRRVLDGLHSQRLTPGTDAMLLRLYHPLLFRDLAAANAAVRNNAMHLLVAVFPLQDSSAPPEVCQTKARQPLATYGSRRGSQTLISCQEQPHTVSNALSRQSCNPKAS